MWELNHKEGWNWSESESCSVVSDSSQPHGLSSSWNSPGQNTGMGSLSLHQGIFLTQESNPGLPHCRRILYQMSHKNTQNWCFWIVVQKKTLASPLDCKEIQPVNHKGNQSWVFIGGIDAEPEAPILWHVRSRLIGKDPDARKCWRQEEKGTTENEMFDGFTDSTDMSLSKLWEIVKGSVVCWSPLACRESDMT